MKLRIWGSTGSIASPGADFARYGGNTSCVQLTTSAGEHLVLDGGTGVRLLGSELDGDAPVHVLLTHLHADHVVGLGFFRPLYTPGREVHLWGPPSDGHSFRTQLSTYFSHPLFPVRLDYLPCDLHVHDLPAGPFDVPGFRVDTAHLAHPGPTVGIRASADGTSAVYIPDHEPYFGHDESPDDESALQLCDDADLVIHDAMYLESDYGNAEGFGHSSVELAARFLCAVKARRVIPFHQDPTYTDTVRDDLVEQVRALLPGAVVDAPMEGPVFEI
ncbi:MAG: MBL fold metallo-hydrolase [Actinomycetota bacterium]|nr:MBL fold metallo-hydrolase [Actinomycetota bacterium]